MTNGLIDPSELKKVGTRIGLLGGTFDPVHYGHLAAALTAREHLQLDAVVFIPAHQPPHKYSSSISSFKSRVEMLTLAVNSTPHFFILEIEAHRDGPSYTCDTLADLRKQLSDNQQLFFITGIDAFREIHTWKRYKSLLDLANFVVITRPPHSKTAIKEYMSSTFSHYSSDLEESCWRSSSDLCTINLISAPPVDISSTQIREVAARAGSLQDLLPPKVATFITNSGLYA